DAGTLDAFRQITRKINGGANGQADRENYWAKAKSALGCGSGTGVVSCTAEGKAGQCIASTSCNGKSVAGLCPGAANI
ncbi:unnamed protein product, partial [Rotaria socialis]